MTDTLTPLQRDALCEIINIGVGQSAQVLSDLVGTEISLSVPSFQVSLPAKPNISRDIDHWHRIGAVAQYFSGALDGKAIFLFPDSDGIELARILVGRGLPETDIENLAVDALQEVGNILLNGCLAALADLLGGQIDSSLPTCIKGSPRTVLADDSYPAGIATIFVHIEFMVEAERIEGSFCFVIHATTLDDLIAKLDRFIAPPSSA
jgi:chemotaxis protein CheC